MTPTAQRRRGILFGIGAYGSWGIMPLYFKMVTHLAGWELLAHRAVWSFVVLAILLWILGRWGDFCRDLRNRRTLFLLALSTPCIAMNWFCFLYAIASGQVLQASLGYFINPLLSVLLGVVVFRERLRPWQIVGISIAAVSVLWLAQSAGHFPWLALALAFSFALYGLFRKMVPVDGLLSLTAETAAMMPVGAAYLGVLTATSRATCDSWAMLGLLMLGGIATTIPLLFFGGAARRLPLSMMGILQYLSPSLQFLVAVAVFHEPLNKTVLISFLGVWLAIVIYVIDSLRAHHMARLEVAEPD